MSVAHHTLKDGSGRNTGTAQLALSETIASDAKHAVALDETLPSDARRAPCDDHPALIQVDPAHYTITTEIARGGMGRIRVGRDRRLGRTVAVKEMLQSDGVLALRFEREARITARLQHPSIVGVYEAGVWPNGFPFYSMPRVNGRSLDEVIAEKQTHAARVSLLPHVLAVADAIAYAHGQRVIHRDLKPKNVLIGSFGETVVIDWGLAKDLDSTQAELETGPYRGHGSGLETEIGEVMGTPAYMPPEQADGEAVDERADVYAIGAMLMHVLTGRAPYEGRSAVEVLDKVKNEPPPSLRERAPDVPPDLVAIVDRAMARDAANRYATARELADDLRKFQNGQLVGAYRYTFGQLLRRWIARRRAVLSISAVAVVVVAVVGVLSIRRVLAERERADAQRVVAEHSQQQAEDLTDFMLGDMRDKLEAVGKLELLDVVARKASSYYVDGVGSKDLGRRAIAMTNIGDVLAARGDQQAARASYNNALGLRLAHAALAPSDADAQAALGTAYVKLATVIREQGNNASALAMFDVALAISEPRLSGDPARWARRYVETQLLASSAAEQGGSVADAESRLGSAARAMKLLEAAEPNRPEHTRLRARVDNDLASVLTSRSETDKALEHRRSALELLETLSAGAPDDTSLRAELAATASLLGDDLEKANQFPASIALYRRVLAIYADLVAHDPSNATWRGDLALAHKNLGRALRLEGDAQAGLAEMTTAVTLAEDVLKNDPTNVQALRRVSSIRTQFAEQYLDDGRLRSTEELVAAAQQAVPHYRIAIELLERVIVLDPTNRATMGDLASTRTQFARALAQSGALDEAEQQYAAALHSAQRLSASDPLNAWWRSNIGQVHMHLGSLLRKRKKLDAAVTELDKALAIQDQLAAAYPTNVEWRREAATTRTFIGNLHYETSTDRAGAAKAVAAYSAALDAAKRMAAEAPGDVQTQNVVAYLEHRVEISVKLLATLK